VLAARRFDRRVDADWRRTSYSGLIRVEETATGDVGSEPEVPGLEDEPDAADPAVATGAVAAAAAAPADPELAAAAEVPSPMADLPAGATFGSLVHAVLEHADPEAPDLRAELRRVAAEQLPWWPVAASPDALADALLPVLETPLGPLVPSSTLGGVPLRDRLRELEFEIPLAGGDEVAARAAGATGPSATAGAEVRLRDLAPLLRAQLPAGDPLAAYADRLERPPLGDQPLRGYLSGSVDAVLRLPDPAGGDRFVVVDYKTNLLGEPDRPVTAADYAPARLAEAMLHSHYPLQALLYSVVVHRFLRWRLPGYDAERHLAGVLYLYVRGMCGADAPLVGGEPCGVFSWRPPAALVESLSDLLDGGQAAKGGAA
jgi:exodeoxyribonuclease V beta subunit